ncbi:unnamed protein product [Periconia digitata]|uniref:NDT80 domain-containing protein n=1 Tax=Periconia digitata TaxID=1303443 RepID=A0A9W4XMW5_9PLEO|nr:unnamed protein product [Periconia digitata]
MNQVLQSPLPLASDDSFLQDQECSDSIGSHAHHPHQHTHSSFAAVPDLKRELSLGQSPSASHLSSSSIASRFPPYRSDPSYPQSTLLHTGSSPLSTPPSSNTSSLLGFNTPAPSPFAYSNSLPSSSNNTCSPFGYGSTMSSSRPPSMMTESSSAMLPPTRTSGLGHPVSPPLASSARDTYASSTPSLSRHTYPLSSPHTGGDLSRYSQDTPRTSLNTPIAIPHAYAPSVMAYNPAEGLQDSPPFHQQETYCDITSEGVLIVPNLEVKIEKGFFYSPDRVWTCYRRNYFAVNVHHGLAPSPSPNSRLYLTKTGSNKQAQQIQSFAVSLAAAVDGSTGKGVDLIQHTAKRDKGPQLTMKKELCAPTPPAKSNEHSNYALQNNYNQGNHFVGPQLPLQNVSDQDSSQQYSPATHTGKDKYQHVFERIQFKYATANNGKRRAQQQYYHLIVDLWANIQNPIDPEPNWVRVASRSSHPVVVRGRSPSHYKDETPHNSNNSRGTGSGGMGGPGHHGLGSNSGTTFSTYTSGLTRSGASGMGSGIYRGATYSLNPSPAGSHSVSSASSLSGGPVENLVGDHHMMDGEDVKLGDSHHDYQYYPAPIYEAKLESASLPHPDRRIKEEYPGNTHMSTGWPLGGGCGRFQGMETSRGYYPDIHTHATGY